MIEIKVENIKEKIRIDKYLEQKLNYIGYSYSRSQIHKYIDNIKLNNKNVKKNTLIREGDIIYFNPPIPQKTIIEAKNIHFDIIYEDSSIAVINKPAGLIVHPTQNNYSDTLVNGLLEKIKDFDEFTKNSDRPGIVHRLDKSTSGLMIIAKEKESYYKLVEMFKKRTINKIYHCISKGIPNFKTKIIETNIGRHQKNRQKFSVVGDDKGKYAKTYLEVLELFKNEVLFKVKIFTGRTHQIRVHLNYINHPILGDKIYSSSYKKYPEGLGLIAKQLNFNHPITNKELNFEINYPDYFINLMNKVKNN